MSASEFIAAPPKGTAPPVAADLVTGDGFWPDVSIAHFRDSTRIGATVTDNRAQEAIIGGMLSADIALQKWRTAREAEGTTKLVDVEGPSIGGVKRPQLLWRRAVYAFAAADLADTHNDISATEAGRERNDVQATSASEHRRNATIAIRDLLGKRRTRSSLV